MRRIAVVALAPAILAMLAAGALSQAASSSAAPAGKPRVYVTVVGNTLGEPAQVRVRASSGVIASATVTVGKGKSVTLTPNGRRAAAPLTWSKTGGVTIKATVWLKGGSRPLKAITYEDIYLPEADSFVLVYALPSDGAVVPGRVSGIRSTAKVVDEWFADQMDGLSPRFVTEADGSASVLTLRTRLTAQGLEGADHLTMDAEVARWFRLGLLKPGTSPVIYLEGKTWWKACGWSSYSDGLPNIVMPMPNCDLYPGSALELGFAWVGSSFLLAHEITHALGAAHEPAPHADGTGHVTDDPRDIIYSGPEARDWQNLMLDPGNDDYYKTGRKDIFNIESSPFIEGRASRAGG